MKKDTAVKVTATTNGTLMLITLFRLTCSKRKRLCNSVQYANLKRSRVEGEMISMDEHPQGCQGNEEPMRKGVKADELGNISTD